jgi:virginiamycin A acetyltransferase
MVRSFVKYLAHRLRVMSGQIPGRDKTRLNGASVHESVDISNVSLSKGNSISPDCLFLGEVTLGKFTTVGTGSIFHGGKILVGNYCQIGPYVSVYAMDHPSNYITTFNGKRLFDGELKSLSVVEHVSIGHDVWIGHGACILKGCKVGDGAIIGAYSLITKNVEAYSIVAGNPARQIRKRFDDETQELIAASNWWSKDPDQLEQFKKVFVKRVEDWDAEDRKVLTTMRNG